MHVLTESAGSASVPASILHTEPSGTKSRPSGARDGRLPVRDLAALYFAEYAGKDKTRVQRLGYWVDRFGDRAIGDVTDDDVADALDALAARPARYYAGSDANGAQVFRAKRKPISGSTLNRYLSAFAALCTFAVRRRYVPRGWPHPAHTVEKAKENPAKTRFLDREEIARLLTAAKASRWPRLHLFVLAAVVTGCRKSELTGLRWGAIDFAEGVLRLETSKNGKPRVVPLTEELMAEMRRFEGGADEHVFPSTRRPGQPMNVAPQFDAAVKRAGLRGVTIHTLRHSCASLLVANGASLFEVQTVLGHSSPAMASRYSHLSVSHKAGLVRRVMGGIGSAS